jgi:hypothetical protein
VTQSTAPAETGNRLDRQPGLTTPGEAAGRGQYDDYPVGSHWYEGGHHWAVLEHTQRDGLPAVRIQCLSGKVRPRVVHELPLRIFERRATRMDNGNQPTEQPTTPKEGSRMSEAATEPQAQAAEAAVPTKDELVALIAQLEAEMEPHREGYIAYEQAHAALREAEAKRKAKKPHLDAKDANREAHKVYWRLYNKRQAARKQLDALYPEPVAEEG